MRPRMVRKRDGSVVAFETARIAAAISLAQQAVGGLDQGLAEELARVVEEHLERTSDVATIGIEDIQDAVVHVLQESGNYEVALAYTRYRDARERFRRQRRAGGERSGAINLTLIDIDGRRLPWEHGWVERFLAEGLGLGPKAAADALQQVEDALAESALTELETPLLLSLVDAALVRCGMHAAAERRSPLRVDRQLVRDAAAGTLGTDAAGVVGRRAIEQLALAELVPAQVVRLYCRGRLWVDGFGDPRRGSRISAAIDGTSNPWQVIASAFAFAAEAAPSWRRINLILPPSILGHLERGATALCKPLAALSELAFVFLYCDGRTPLLDHWPFLGKRVSIATYADDFLLLRRLQELNLPMLAGPHLMQGGYRSRVAVELALNAQGLDNEYSQMDQLAMGAVAAARARQQQLAADPTIASGDLRFAIYGLPANSPSTEYLERQVVQEGQRTGMTLQRTTNLTEEACAHLGRLLEVGG